MGSAAVKIAGAKETKAAFRKAGNKVGRDAFKTVNKHIGRIVAEDSQSRARGGTQEQHHATKAIKGGGTVREAFVAISNTSALPYGVIAFMGSKRRTGWYAKGRYADSEGKQHLPWVGNQHQAGARTVGLQVYPYHVGPAILENIDKIGKEYERAILKEFQALGLTD